jgi:cell division protein ZapA
MNRTANDGEQLAVVVEILGKDYRIACAPEEKDALLRASKYLNEKVREIKSSGRIIGNEKIAAMAALNLSHELLSLQEGEREKADALRSKVQKIKEKVSDAVGKNTQLKL